MRTNMLQQDPFPEHASAMPKTLSNEDIAQDARRYHRFGTNNS